MTPEPKASPRLSVWDLPRGTIRQFAEALAAERGSLSADAAEQQILYAIWLGVFEPAGECFVSLREPFNSAQEIPKPPTPFTREDLRDAAGYWRPAKGTPEQERRSRFEIIYIDKTGFGVTERDYQEWRKRDPAEAEYKQWRTDTGRTVRTQEKRRKIPEYHAFVDRPPDSYSELFQQIYPDLLIDTDAMRDWLTDLKNAGAGRPSVMHIIVDEARRRIDEGEEPRSASAFADSLHAWFLDSWHCKGTIRPVKPPGVGTIANHVRTIMRAKKLLVKRK